MELPFLSEISIVSFNFAPRGWAMCNGQLLPINQNQALFSLLGTTFGGDGRVNFALPDFRGRIPVHVGNGFTLGQRGGEQAHTLSLSELATHSHIIDPSTNKITAKVGDASNAADIKTPTNAYYALNASENQRFSDKSDELMKEETNIQSMIPATSSTPLKTENVGGSQAHINMMPFLVLNYIIALQGIFPSPN